MAALIRKQPRAAVYVAATRQHVGKTSTCLGLLQGLSSRMERIGFFKPVGQESVVVEGGSRRVDKDVAVAKEVFKLKTCNYRDMSPVVIMPGYTKRFLDGEITVESQLDKIRASFKRITEANEFTVVEGTGHTGVGSIVDCNNARIAAELGVDMVLVANGGLGSAFDDLALNYTMCKAHGVKIRGVILNRVLDDRVEMLQEYFPKAMKHWGGNVPLIGIVPNSPVLSNPSMLDFEGLFATEMLTSRVRRFQQYDRTALVTAGLRRFLEQVASPEFERALFVTHVSRNDIIMGFLSHAQNFELMAKRPYGGGLILTGSLSADSHQDYIMNIIKHAQAPVLHVPTTTFAAMEKITHFTAKFNPMDEQKVRSCGKHYARHIDFDAILER
uniref:DRTGG domain-containing protein n=1 Tax=Peronospora matthiolae TaxID=2874970 RepID=A0AAV1URI0_9STRA